MGSRSTLQPCCTTSRPPTPPSYLRSPCDATAAPADSAVTAVAAGAVAGRATAGGAGSAAGPRRFSSW